MSPNKSSTGGVWSGKNSFVSWTGRNRRCRSVVLFVAAALLTLSATTADARRFSWQHFFGCEELPQGRWRAVSFAQTNLGNTTLLPRTIQDIVLTEQIPNIYTGPHRPSSACSDIVVSAGKANISVTEFFPNPEILPPDIPLADILLVRDPKTCSISMSLYSFTVLPFNDVMVLTLRNNRLSGPFMGSINTNILTDVVSRFEVEYLGPE